MGSGAARQRGRNTAADPLTPRPLGPSLILGGALASIAAMFLPFRRFGGQSFTLWEYASGLDIALLTACFAAAGLALAALTLGHSRTRQLAGLAGAVTFGLGFAPVPGAVDYSGYAGAGLWIVGGTATIALAGAVVTTLLPGNAARRSLGWIAIPVAGAALVAGLAVANPFGDDYFKPKVPAQENFDLLDAGDANGFAEKWARHRMRPGERTSVGCEEVPKTWPPRFECDIRYRERPPGYKVILRRTSELHVAAVRPAVAYYTEDGEPDVALDRNDRNRWRVIRSIPLGGESKLERKVRTALGYETDRADITRVECRRQSGRDYSCTARLRSGRCRDAEVRDDPALTIDDIRFSALRSC
jgi:hypothetical protein